MATPNTALAQRPKFSTAISTESYQKLIRNTLGDPDRAKRFVASITSAVAVNPGLQECEAGTILAGALLGESLGLPPAPQLGYFYLVPFKQKEKRDRVTKEIISPACVNAAFVLGYKGYIQLALRSGLYKKLNVIEIKQGEFVKWDPMIENLSYRVIDDFNVRENTPTVGYFAMFELLNGFCKAIYWSKEKMLAHADRYSPAFSASAYAKLMAGEIPEQDRWKYSSFWYTQFDDMAKKTMIRQLLSTYGPMSAELQQAFVSDSEVMSFDTSGQIVQTPQTIEQSDPVPPPTQAENVNLDDL